MGNKRHTLNPEYLNLKNLDNARYLDNENDVLKMYLREVRKFKPIPVEDELKMIKNYQMKGPGYKEDMERVLGYNQRFLLMIVKRYCPTTVNICDLISEANIGMVEAINKFDASFGAKFITYAGRHIIKCVFEYLENNGFVKQPNRGKIHGAIERVNEYLFNKNGYYPTIDEIEEEFKKRGVVVKDKSDFIDVEITSIDTYSDNDESCDKHVEFGVYDNIEDRTDNEFIRKNIKMLLEKLTDVEKTVIIRTFGFDGSDNTSLATIARDLGVSEYKVKMHLESGINKMRKYKSIFV